MADTFRTEITELDGQKACPKCGQIMAEGEIVIMDWAGDATEHITCPKAEAATA